MRYTAATILLVGIGVICSILLAHPSVENNPERGFANETVSQSEIGARYVSELSAVGKTFSNSSHGAPSSPFTSFHFFIPEIDELDKIDLSLTVRAHQNSWKVPPSVLGSHALPTIYSFVITDKTLSLLETVVLLN